MAKKVEYNGQTYKITTRNYAYAWQKLSINGEESNIQIRNELLDNVDEWKTVVKKAIIEYKDREVAKKEFNQWDGKL
jgi:hypothetical protein